MSPITAEMHSFQATKGIAQSKRREVYFINHTIDTMSNKYT